MVELFDCPHRRFNPLVDEWVLVSPHRTKRPWLGQVETLSPQVRPQYDPGCYLCPGNARAGGSVNPAYRDTFVFENDFAALLPNGFDQGGWTDGPYLAAEPTVGECRVICFSPRHDLTMAEMGGEEIQSVVQTWIDTAIDLGSRYKWVQIFENKGASMGASNPHPHGQVWACDYLPTVVAKELECQRRSFLKTGANLLAEVAELEISRGDRVVVVNDHWVVIVPFWAVWPYEYLLLPRRPVQRLTELTKDEKTSLAETLKLALAAYDRLFQASFPYTMGWHGAPFDGQDYSFCQLHAHFYPPLLRSATVRKFMVGFEMLGEAQRDITPEQAAARLRSFVKAD